MYEVLSITVVLEPLSAAFVIMSGSCLIWRLACRSVAVGLSRYFKAYAKAMPSVTANKSVFRTCSRS